MLFFSAVTCAWRYVLQNGRTTHSKNPEFSAYYSLRFPYETKLSFQCNNGYTLEGPSSKTCQSSGQWNPSGIPRCRKNGKKSELS